MFVTTLKQAFAPLDGFANDEIDVRLDPSLPTSAGDDNDEDADVVDHKDNKQLRQKLRRLEQKIKSVQAEQRDTTTLTVIVVVAALLINAVHVHAFRRATA
jgi:hypothetical protein